MINITVRDIKICKLCEYYDTHEVVDFHSCTLNSIINGGGSGGGFGGNNMLTLNAFNSTEIPRNCPNTHKLKVISKLKRI